MSNSEVPTCRKKWQKQSGKVEQVKKVINKKYKKAEILNKTFKRK